MTVGIGNCSHPPPGLNGRILQGAVEVYKRETRRIVWRFRHHQLSFPNCIAALDTALARLIPEMQPAQLYELRNLMLTNNETVMEEMARRAQSAKPRGSLDSDH